MMEGIPMVVLIAQALWALAVTALLWRLTRRVRALHEEQEDNYTYCQGLDHYVTQMQSVVVRLCDAGDFDSCRTCAHRGLSPYGILGPSCRVHNEYRAPYEHCPAFAPREEE